MIDLGKVSITPKGDFSIGISYEKLDLVIDNESSYLSLSDNNNSPITDTSKWQLIAAKGKDGDKGDKGEKGDTGYKTIDPYSISPSDPAPTVVGWYKPTQVGEYTNIGLTVLAGYDTFIYFSGTEWVKSEIPVSTVISDGMVTTEKTDFATTETTYSKNIADPSKKYTGNYIDWDTGNLATNPAYNAFFKLPVTGDIDYFFTKIYHLAWYDIAGNFISGENVGGISTSRHAPVLAKYVSASFSVSDVNIQIEVGTSGTPYVPFSVTKKVDIADLVVKPNQTSFAEEKLIYGKNRFDKTKTVAGQFVNAFTGANNPNPSYQASDFCYIEDLTKITLTSLIHIAFYDVNKSYLEGREYGGDTINVPANAVWCRASLFDNGMEQTFQIEGGENKTSYQAYSDPVDKIIIPNLFIENPSPEEIKRPSIVTTSLMYWAAGRQMNVYFDSSIYNPIADSTNYYTSVFSYRGKFLENKYRVVPTDDFNFILRIEDSKGTVIQKNTDVLTASTSSGAGQNRKILVIGDSTVNAGVTIKEISDFFSTDPMDVTFQGTRTTLGLKHEGRGGWTFNDYCTEGRSLYKFNHGGALVSKDDVYSNNGSNYKVVEINTGYFSAQRIAGSSLPTSSGVLSKISGTGDSSINYTSYEILDGNPFWNYITLSFDFSMYLSNTSQTIGSNDWVFIQLGINDLFGSALGDSFNVDARINQMKTQLSTMINNIHSYNPNIRIGIIQTIPPAISQDATGNLNNSSFYSIEYYVKKGLVKWWNEVITTYDNLDSRNNKIYLLGTASTIDRVNNFPKTTEPIDSHNNTLVEVYNNDVHPSDAGYKQIADVYIGIIKYFG